jgi:hypothetical protein
VNFIGQNLWQYLAKGISAKVGQGEGREGIPATTIADMETRCCTGEGSERPLRACRQVRMDNWLRIPTRRKGIPQWRLCLMMAVTLLTLWVGAPVLFAMAARTL